MEKKFGNAKINNRGYYVITSRKEGNNMKYLHRLVWEDFYGKPVPEGYVIHHLNGDKTDNRIQNLQCVTKEAHTRFHHKGKVVSDEHRKKMREAKKGWEPSEETRKKMSENHADFSGENNPMYDKKHSDETRKKMSEAKKGRTLSDETKKKISEAQKGENHPQWKDYARVVKLGKEPYNGKQKYALKYNGKRIKHSINKEKLERLAEKINKGDK